MSDSPKFEVIDRRKFKADEEHESEQPTTPAATPGPEPAKPVAAPHEAGPRLVGPPTPVEESERGDELFEMPPPPTAQETSEQKTAYDASAQRVEDLLRAQNPAMGAPEAVTFDHLVQQLYVSAMLQMGAGTPQGQSARIKVTQVSERHAMASIVESSTKPSASGEYAEPREMAEEMEEADE